MKSSTINVIRDLISNVKVVKSHVKKNLIRILNIVWISQKMQDFFTFFIENMIKQTLRNILGFLSFKIKFTIIYEKKLI